MLNWCAAYLEIIDLIARMDVTTTQTVCMFLLLKEPAGRNRSDKGSESNK